MNAKIEALVQLFIPEVRRISMEVYFTTDIIRKVDYWLELGKIYEDIKSYKNDE